MKNNTLINSRQTQDCFRTQTETHGFFFLESSPTQFFSNPDITQPRLMDTLNFAVGRLGKRKHIPIYSQNIRENLIEKKMSLKRKWTQIRVKNEDETNDDHWGGEFTVPKMSV